jgi:transcriptional antiterminator NusG
MSSSAATEQKQTSIYPVKTTGGQERTVATFVAERAKQKKKPIYSILALDTWKGYVLFEAPNSQVVDEAIQGFKHIRSKIPGMMQFSDIEKFLVTKSMVAVSDACNIGRWLCPGHIEGADGRS